MSLDLIGQLIMIKTDFDKIVYGWVYLFDEVTKTLILSKENDRSELDLEVIDDKLYESSGGQEEEITGMGVYNVGNIEFEGIV